MRLTYLLCLILLDVWPGHANKAESDKSCRSSDQLEKDCGPYAHSMIKPMMAYFKQVNLKLDNNDAEMERKNSQIRQLKEKLMGLQIEAESKKNYTIQLEEKVSKLQMENPKYKTKEDSLAAVLQELTSQKLKIEQLTNKLCEKQNIQIEDLKEQFQSETHKNIECEAKLNNQKEIIASKDTKILQLELKVKESIEKAKEIENLTQEMKLLNISREQQNNDMAKLNVKINLEAQKATECNVELNNQKIRTAELISLKDKKLETESVEKSNEIESMKQQINLLNSLNSQLISENTKLNENLNIDSQKVKQCELELKNQKVMSRWTIIQQRVRGGVDFYRKWTEYKNGFGDFWDGDFFLGLEMIHRLTSAQPHELFIQMEYFNSTTFFAKYDEFAISGEGDKYRLIKLGKFSGNTSDELSYHINMSFSTSDSDNDVSGSDCTGKHLGGWWYNYCTKTNLNGKYFQNEVIDQAENIFWRSWTPIKEVRMMIRPKLQ